jgi:hypothetical protein
MTAKPKNLDMFWVFVPAAVLHFPLVLPEVGTNADRDKGK